MSRNLQGKPMIERLLSTNPALRGSVHELKKHQWLEGTDWDNLLAKQTPAPYVPPIDKIAINNHAGDLMHEIQQMEAEKEISLGRRAKAGPKNWDSVF